jgi:hypothetical protein
VTVVRSDEPDCDSLFAGSQQHVEATRPVQHALAAWLALVGEQADASPTAGNIPATTARAVQASRS